MVKAQIDLAARGLEGKSRYGVVSVILTTFVPPMTNPFTEDWRKCLLIIWKKLKEEKMNIPICRVPSLWHKHEPSCNRLSSSSARQIRHDSKGWSITYSSHRDPCLLSCDVCSLSTVFESFTTLLKQRLIWFWNWFDLKNQFYECSYARMRHDVIPLVINQEH